MLIIKMKMNSNRSRLPSPRMGEGPGVRVLIDGMRVQNAYFQRNRRTA
jgi:hypothetical protein